MVEAARVDRLPGLDDQLVVTVCSTRDERFDSRLQLIGRAEQRGQAAEVFRFAADEHREAQRPAISESAHVEVVDAPFPELPEQLEAPHRPDGVVQDLEIMSTAP